MEEYPSKRPRLSRIQVRAPDFQQTSNKRDEHAADALDRIPIHQVSTSPNHMHEPLLVREMNRRRAMESKHRLLHRRQNATRTANITVTVSVVELLGADGSASLTTLPVVPSQPGFPSSLTVPSVPSVPTQSPVTLPSVPSVPSFPFASTSNSPASTSVDTAAQIVTGGSSQAILTSPSSTSSPSTTSGGLSLSVSVANVNSISASSLDLHTDVPSTFLTRLNSTVSSTSTQSSTQSSQTSSLPLTDTASSTTQSSTLSATQSSALSSKSSQNTPTSVQTKTQTSSSSASVSSTVTNVGGLPPAAPAPTSSSGVTVSSTSDDRSSGLPTSQVIGSVVGSIAGLAVLLILALILLRWYKRRRRALQRLSESEQPITRAPNTSFLPPVASSLLSRLSGKELEAGVAAPQEKGFQRISGRKLPSAFSEGMTSDTVPDTATLSGSSFYRDSHGFWGGSGMAPRSGEPSRQSEFDKETMMPSPARTPVIHHPGGHSSASPRPPTMSPPHSPAPSRSRPDSRPIGTLGRSHPSHDGSRGSKFTEDV